MTNFNHSLAVLVGIDAYANGIPRLATAVNDATRLAELLRAEHHYETMLLTELTTGQSVTRERLAALFTEALPARLGEDDRLLVYFAGHGVALDGDDGPRGYLVPQDGKPGDSASMLAMTDLHAWLNALPCRHMLAILDCCFAGAFRWASTRHVGALPDVIHQERYDRYLLSPAWQVLTSAAYDQKALDVLGGNVLGRREADGRHSPFALALFDALEQGAADLVPKDQGDGVITATELYLYLREQVEVQAEAQASHEQTPGLWPLNKHRKGEFIFLAPGHPLNLPPAPDLTAELNPYRGLKSYDQRHTQLFFGREEEIEQVVALADQQPFVAVLGASGTGKSSLVKAGVLPRLQVAEPAPDLSTSGGLQVAGSDGAPSYHVLSPMRPMDHPLRALEALLRSELPADFSGLAQGDDALAQIVGRWAKDHPGQRMVLTIDQFEELATLCRDDAERERFLRLLAVAVLQHPNVLCLIITVRTDFEPQFTQAGSPLAQHWQAARYVVPPMDIEDLRQVIEGPASVCVLYFDPPELVDDLIKEVIQTPGALPLLSFTLSELYVKYVHSGRDDRALSGRDYQALGGVVGSLRNRATEEYDSLPDDAHRLTMQRVMLRMVAAEGGGELARRRVALSELVYPTEKDNLRVQTILDRLVEARLLVRGKADNPDGTKGEPYAEPAHDALVLAWDKLLRWKQEAEEYLPLQRRLAQAATEWDRAEPKAKSGLLWDDDPRLAQVEETLWPTGSKQKGVSGRVRWAKRMLAPQSDAPPDTRWLNAPEVAFTQASVNRRASTLRRIIGITAAVMVALTGLALLASYQASQATQQRDLAITAEAKAVSESNARATEVVVRATAQAEAVVSEKRAVAAQETAVVERDIAQSRELAMKSVSNLEPDPPLALTLALTALEKASTLEAGDALRQAMQSVFRKTDLTGHTAPVAVAAYSPDGRLVLTIDESGEARTWDAVTGQLAAVFEAAPLASSAPAFSSDGRRAATPDRANNVYIWDTSNGELTTVLKGHDAVVSSSAFSPDGSHVLTASADNTARLWNVSTGQQLALFDNLVDVEGFSDSTAQRQGAFDDTGRWVITWLIGSYAGAANPIVLWDARTGQEVARYPNGQAWSVAKDGLRVLVVDPDAGMGATARVIEVVSGTQISVIGSDAQPYTDNYVLFDESGGRVVSWSFYGDAHVWDVATGRLLFTLPEQGSGVGSQGRHGFKRVTISAQDTRAATVGQYGVAHLWNLTASSKPLANLGQADDAWFSANGEVLLTQDGSSATEWDALTGRRVVSFPDIRHVTFNPVSNDVLTFDQQAALWKTGAEVVTLRGHNGAVNQASFNPMGDLILTSGSDGASHLWETSTGRMLLTKRYGSGSGYGAQSTFSPDGALVLTSHGGYGQSGGGIEVWDTRTGDTVAARSEGYLAWCTGFTSDGMKVICSLDAWHAEPLALLDAQTLERIFVSPADKDTAIRYTPNGNAAIINSSDGQIQVWDVAANRLLRESAVHGSVLEFSPDSRHMIVKNSEGSLFEVDLSNDTIVSYSPPPPIGSAWGRVSPNGRLRATMDEQNSVSLWEVSDGRFLATLRGHNDRINDVEFSPDNHLIATASADKTVRLWDIATGQLLDTLRGATRGVSEVQFSPDGRLVVAASADGTTRVYYSHLDDVITLARSRSTRPLSCAERVIYLHESLDCAIP